MNVEPQCENCSKILIDEGEYVNKKCWECIEFIICCTQIQQKQEIIKGIIKRKIHECMGGKLPCPCHEEESK
tara:strand:- start:3774 stop:3989 length:216 start_codon:yes stop_codon:yes gene_type:complete